MDILAVLLKSMVDYSCWCIKRRSRIEENNWRFAWAVRQRYLYTVNKSVLAIQVFNTDMITFDYDCDYDYDH